jgi:hypothetical protein
LIIIPDTGVTTTITAFFGLGRLGLGAIGLVHNLKIDEQL